MQPHVRFVVGGLDRQVDILGLIGSLQAEVVEVAYDAQRPVAEVPGPEAEDEQPAGTQPVPAPTEEPAGSQAQEVP